MCLILLVPVKFPDQILAPEVASLRDPLESKEKKNTLLQCNLFSLTMLSP